MNQATFVGVDLAWHPEKHPSGVAVLKGDRQRAQLLCVDASVLSVSALVEYVEKHATPTTCVAVDAPLVIRNEVGQRRCETLLGRCYGAQHASCHSSNLSKYPDAPGVRLAQALSSRNFRHAPDSMPAKSERVMLEVYPHPALLELFRLSSIIRYKKGKVEQRRRGQRELQQCLNKLSDLNPPLDNTELSKFLAVDTNSLSGTALKAYEDKLDAVVCSYIAYHYWFWGLSRTHLFGDVNAGCIMVPMGSSHPAE